MRKAVCDLLCFRQTMKGRCRMKKKITAVFLALSMIAGGSVFAKPLSIDARNSQKAVVMCYDSGELVYSVLCTAKDGKFDVDIPQEYENTQKKMCIIDTLEFVDINEISGDTDTPSPSPSAEPTAAPSPEPTKKPSSADTPAIYEKALDAIYAPALVKEVQTVLDGNDDECYAVTVFYQGEEVTVNIESDLAISAAPEAYAFMQGATADKLKEGDVICMTTNVSGDRIKYVYLLFRSTEEDIVTGDEDFGESFEKLISTNSTWESMEYGKKPSSERYQYAFGVVGKKSGSTLTLINKSGDLDNGIEIDLNPDTIVYTCDTSGREYEMEIGGIADILATIPQGMLDKGAVDLNEDYSYNYAFVRIVNKTATEVILYNNYNE